MIKINGIEIEKTIFPNNEIMIRTEDIKRCLDNYSEIDRITFKFENNSDIIDLFFITKTLKDMNRKIELLITYIPYSRMDRTEGQTVFTLKYFTSLINSLGYNNIIVCEPHSDVSLALLDGEVEVVNSTAAITNELIQEFNFSPGKDYILYPDAGAAKRYSKQIKYPSVLVANKDRDFATGRINNMTIHSNDLIPYKPFRVIIVDDLCSYGGTFMLAAKKLREMGATEVYLAVTHTEDSIYNGEILKTDLIDKVYTTNSVLNNYESNKIYIYDVC